jgi:hypothetical protein
VEEVRRAAIREWLLVLAIATPIAVFDIALDQAGYNYLRWIPSILTFVVVGALLVSAFRAMLNEPDEWSVDHPADDTGASKNQ